jgi:hypothetical protein
MGLKIPYCFLHKKILLTTVIYLQVANKTNKTLYKLQIQQKSDTDLQPEFLLPYNHYYSWIYTNIKHFLISLYFIELISVRKVPAI